MLIKISEVCKAACSHCLEDAKPTGQHMSFETFYETVRFSLSIGDNTLLISGGEPTENPQFEEFLDYLKEIEHLLSDVFILSHGGWLDSNPERFELFNKYKEFKWQITSDSTFYPKPLSKETIKKLSQQKNVLLTQDLHGGGMYLYPQGRALQLKITVESTRAKAPKSFNLRSMIINNNMSFDQAVLTLRALGKMCSPSINFDGTISMGESRLCEHVAHIHDSITSITNKIRKSQCNNCGMVDKLTPEFKAAINYQSKTINVKNI